MQTGQAFLSSAIHTLILLPPFAKWLARLKDAEGRGEVHDRIAKARGGNFGDVRLVDANNQSQLQNAVLQFQRSW
jgi:hypothetical protein